MEFLNTLWDTIKNFPWINAYLIIKYLFIGASIIIFAAFIVLVPYLWKWKRKYNIRFKYKNKPGEVTPEIQTEAVQQKWQDLMKNAELSPPESLSSAIIEADELTDNVLKQMRIPGEHMADRLDGLNPENIKSLERLWGAHRIKNNLIHISAFEITDTEARNVLGDYETFLKEIGAL
ncbi:hypothetical protein CL629_00025 [bacterium]|nr:hypothetical protein [bacterium]|tara:strand:- start:1794 stop:2324 length:531 start_codon:yes stop_codon:yes gene_type:complete